MAIGAMGGGQWSARAATRDAPRSQQWIGGFSHRQLNALACSLGQGGWAHEPPLITLPNPLPSELVGLRCCKFASGAVHGARRRRLIRAALWKYLAGALVEEAQVFPRSVFTANIELWTV